MIGALNQAFPQSSDGTVSFKLTKILVVGMIQILMLNE